MKNIFFMSLTFLAALFIASCNYSNPISTNANSNSPLISSQLIASGDWSFKILYVPLADPNPSLPVSLPNAKVFIEKIGVGIVSDTLVTDMNGNVLFNIKGQYSNGEYIVHVLHYDKVGALDLGGNKYINYVNSPAGVYATIICSAIDP